MRFYNYVPIRRRKQDEEGDVQPDEISSKLKFRNGKYEILSRQGTVYTIRHTETKKERRAHVTQLARMRGMAEEPAARMAPAQVSGELDQQPASPERMWDRMRVGSFAVIWDKDYPRSVLRLMEITQVNQETGEFSGWYWVHSRRETHYNAERPLGQWVAAPEYKKNDGSTGWVGAIVKRNPRSYVRLIETYQDGEFELIHTGFNMESGGKVPATVCKKVDAWLRRQLPLEPRALVPLSQPTDAEAKRQDRLEANIGAVRGETVLSPASSGRETERERKSETNSSQSSSERVTAGDGRDSSREGLWRGGPSTARTPACASQNSGESRKSE